MVCLFEGGHQPKKAVTAKKRHNPDKKVASLYLLFLLSLSPKKWTFQKKLQDKLFEVVKHSLGGPP